MEEELDLLVELLRGWDLVVEVLQDQYTQVCDLLESLELWGWDLLVLQEQYTQVCLGVKRIGIIRSNTNS